MSVNGNLLLETESAVFVRVEEFDQAVGLALTHSEVALVPQEVEDLDRAHEGVSITVESLESRVWCKVADRADFLASCFESSLPVTDCDEQILESVL